MMNYDYDKVQNNDMLEVVYNIMFNRKHSSTKNCNVDFMSLIKSGPKHPVITVKLDRQY